LTQQEAADATSASQQAFNLRQLRAGNALTVGRSVEGRLREIDYRIDADRMLKIRPQEQGFSATLAEIPSRAEIVAVRGTLDDSLFNAVEETGESAELAMRMAQIFGYDLDFYIDPRQGDTFCILLEKKRYANGQTAGYGRIFAAEYNHAGKKYRALLYHDPAGQPGYYTEDGKSLEKAFLRSPLKFGAAVTSHFSRARFHPILKTYRAHLGTDYGAPIGTPVQTIGSGRITFAGRKGGEGNMVQIAHATAMKPCICISRKCSSASANTWKSARRLGWSPVPDSPPVRILISAFCRRGSQEFRAPGPASFRSGVQEEFSGVRRATREVVAASEKPRDATGSDGRAGQHCHRSRGWRSLSANPQL
jgi:murein DD-endopeptidase MepM/ murein hydrolase activator NlpD